MENTQHDMHGMQAMHLIGVAGNKNLGIAKSID